MKTSDVKILEISGLEESRTSDLRHVNSPFKDFNGLFEESKAFNSSFSCPLLSVPQECSKTDNGGLVDLELLFTRKELRAIPMLGNWGLLKNQKTGLSGRHACFGISHMTL